MPERNSVTWNSLMCGYLIAEVPNCVMQLFLGMIRDGIAVTAFGVSFALMGCTRLGASEVGLQLHGLCLKNGFLSSVVVGTGFIDMYGKCWGLEAAWRVFECMHERNEVTWTTMIAVYAHYELPYEGMFMFREMKRVGHRPSHVTCNCLLSLFSGSVHLDHCKQIHSHIIRDGLESNEYIQISLVTAYAECSCRFDDFERICSCIQRFDQVSWNAIISGFSHLEHNDKALQCFVNMRRSGIACDFMTLTSILRLIGMISCLEYGRQVHALALKVGSGSNLHVQNGLVSMYGRCGVASDAKDVFFGMKEPDLISWNSLLAGLCHHGYGEEVVKLFEAMRRTEIQPDQNTFISVVSACSHSGLVTEGVKYFDMMRKLYPGHPISMHMYASMVDMFARRGYIYEAEAFIRNMPVEPGPAIYKCLLSACKLHGNLEVGEWASKRLLEEYPNDAATYALLSNSLATRGRWDEAEGVRKLMDCQRAEKMAGCSWVE
ncbi:hypothetical protein vseg_010111 [Gypsophila vaccaria]